jgi:hypothetical protein
MKTLEKLVKIESDILKKSGDDELQHSLEDKMMQVFIEDCDKLDILEIVECQKCIKRVWSLKFSRWCA